MFSRLLVCLALLLPAAARAECTGTDLLAAMPADQRATLIARAEAAPFASGLLWQATRGDTRLVIFGTYHLRHAATFAHVDAVLPHLDAAEIAWFELDAEATDASQRAMAQDPSLAFITTGPTMPDLLGEPLWTQYAEAMTARGIPRFMAAKFKPMMGLMMLGIGPCQARAGALERPGIDKILADHARDSGIATGSLDDFRALMAAFDAFSPTEQMDMLRLYLDLPDMADDLAHTLLQAYLAQDVALIWEFSREMSLQHGGPTAARDLDRFEQVLLWDRNTAWVAQLLQEAEGKTAFVAVGAGHLPYDQGVLALLQEAGFAVTPLPFTP